MFLALRELRFARGQFTLMGIVIALIAVLVVLLSGLSSGWSLLAEQARRSKVAVVTVTHDHDVLEHRDKVFEMVDGKLSAVAPRQGVGNIPSMEILKNVALALHIIGVASLLGGVLVQIPAMKSGTARVIPAILHGAWTMLITGVILVGLQYPLGNEVNNAKITVKLAILVAILVVALMNRKRETLAGWVLPVLGGLTTANVLIATVWKNYS